MPTKQKAAAKKNTVNYGSDVTGTLRIFAKSKSIELKDKKKVSITDHWFNFSRKLDEGDYLNASMKAIFERDSETPENNSLITFKGFLTMTGTKDYERVAIYVTEWDYAEE
jgi:hypothetical protein